MSISVLNLPVCTAFCLIALMNKIFKLSTDLLVFRPWDVIGDTENEVVRVQLGVRVSYHLFHLGA